MFSAAVQTLRRNYPATFSNNVFSADEDDDYTLANALEDNQYIRHLHIFYSGYQLRDRQLQNLLQNFRAFRTVISRLNRLEMAALADHPDPNHGVPDFDIVAFMEAIAQNQAIIHLYFHNVRLLGSATVALLDTMTQLTGFAVHECQMGPNCVTQVAAALRTHTHLQVIFFAPVFTNVEMLPILQQVALREHGQFSLALSMERADGTNNENR